MKSTKAVFGGLQRNVSQSLDIGNILGIGIGYRKASTFKVNRHSKEGENIGIGAMTFFHP